MTAVKIKLQADADFNADIVRGVLRRAPQIDFQSADDAHLRGLSDQQVLSQAIREERILLTHDWRTMPIEFANF